MILRYQHVHTYHPFWSQDAFGPFMASAKAHLCLVAYAAPCLFSSLDILLCRELLGLALVSLRTSLAGMHSQQLL